jgi:SAM-dependent methyltransferase
VVVKRRLGILARALRRLVRPAPDSLTEQVVPVSRVFGLDRGTPIDRHYIEGFLAAHAHHIRGHVLEVGETTYSRRFGGGQVEAAEALLFHGEARAGALSGDLTDAATLPREHSDCFICTQTLNFIFDVRAAVEGAHRLLRPGGVMLATVAGISQISRYDMDRWGDFWRFTPASLERLLAPIFLGGVEVRGHGNVMAATAFLHGLAVEDLADRGRLEEHDVDYPLVVTAVARRAP